MIYKFITRGNTVLLDIDVGKEYVDKMLKEYMASTDNPFLLEFIAYLESDGIEVREIEPEYTFIFGDVTEIKIKTLAKYLNVDEKDIKTDDGELFIVNGEVYRVIELDGDIVKDEKLIVIKVEEKK